MTWHDMSILYRCKNSTPIHPIMQMRKQCICVQNSVNFFAVIVYKTEHAETKLTVPISLDISRMAQVKETRVTLIADIALAAWISIRHQIVNTLDVSGECPHPHKCKKNVDFSQSTPPTTIPFSVTAHATKYTHMNKSRSFSPVGILPIHPWVFSGPKVTIIVHYISVPQP